MVRKIRACAKCNLCQNQQPLLDEEKRCQIFWVGLSAKLVTTDDERPLSPTTNSGRLICNVEEKCSGIETYRTNLVKCVPLDDHRKLRYPNIREMELCFPNLENEIKELVPRIVFLLGDKVATTISKKFNIKFNGWDEFNYTYKEYNGTYYVPIHHPSYIYVYKRKQIDSYINGISDVISLLM